MEIFIVAGVALVCWGILGGATRPSDLYFPPGVRIRGPSGFRWNGDDTLVPRIGGISMQTITVRIENHTPLMFTTIVWWHNKVAVNGAILGPGQSMTRKVVIGREGLRFTVSQAIPEIVTECN